MQTEFYLKGLPQNFMRFVVEKLHKRKVLCIAKARRNLCGNKINLFGNEVSATISIKKGDEFLVLKGSECDYNRIKRYFFPFPVTVYQAESIVCQTKWKGQPYKFFFKDK